MSNSRNFGKYELLEPIGTGGMAEVYKARLPGAHGLDKIVAIKRILPYYCEDRSFVQMFLDEAKITLALNHPNIGQVYEVNQVDDSYFIAMEHIDGPNLSHVLKKLRRSGYRMPLDLTVYIMTQVCGGLYAAHTQCDHEGNPMYIIHRDVSPHNVLVSRRGAVKLIDFGIAKAKDRLVQTQHGAVRGKLLYLSPEQASRRDLDARSDIFSAGMMFLTLMNGIHPWRGKDEVEVLIELRNWSLPDLRPMRPKLADSVQVRLRNVLSRAMAFNPGDRYPDAESFRIELQQLLTQINPVFSPVTLGRFVADVMEGRFEEAEPADASLPGSLAVSQPSSASLRDHFGSSSRPRLSPELAERSRNTSNGTLTAFTGPRLSLKLKADQTPSGQTPSGVYTPAPDRHTPSGPAATRDAGTPSDEAAATDAPKQQPTPQPQDPDATPLPERHTQLHALDSEPAPTPNRTPVIILGVLVVVMAVLVAVVAMLVFSPSPAGTLVIRSVPPGATIELDGETLEPVTPARIDRVAPGQHDIVLTSNAGRFETSLAVGDGEELIVVGRLNATKAPKEATPTPDDSKPNTEAGTPPEATDQPDAGTAATAPDSGTTEATAPGGGSDSPQAIKDNATDAPTEDNPDGEYATMAIATNVSNARVLIDGHPLLDRTGRAPLNKPLEVTGLAIGRTYEVRVEHRGYNTARTRVTVDSARVEVELPLKRKEEARPGFLTITTIPYWTQVYVNGRKVANQTPLIQYRLAPGNYNVRLVNPEQKINKSFSVKIKPGEPTTRRFTFQ